MACGKPKAVMLLLIDLTYESAGTEYGIIVGRRHEYDIEAGARMAEVGVV